MVELGGGDDDDGAYSHFRHRPLHPNDVNGSRVRRPNVCKTRGCIIACLVVLAVSFIGCLAVFIMLTYCLQQCVRDTELSLCCCVCCPACAVLCCAVLLVFA